MRKLTSTFLLALLVLVAPAARSARAASDSDSGTPWLGVSTQTLDDALRDAMDLTGKGALVSRVVDDSPADRAGIQKGDVIIRFGGRPVESSDDLVRDVRDARIGQNVTVEVRRGRDTRTLTALLEERPADMGMPSAPEAPQAPSRRTIVKDLPGSPDDQRRIVIRRGTGDDSGDLPDLSGLPHAMRMFGDGNMMMMGLGRGRLGVRVQDLNAQLGEYFGVPDGHGVLVTEVVKDSPAERVGLKAGDVITRVDDKEIENSSDLIRTLQGKEGRVRVSFVRRGESRTLEPELEARASRRPAAGGGERLAPEPTRGGNDDLDGLRDQLRQMREEIQQLRRELEESRNNENK